MTFCNSDCTLCTALYSFQCAVSMYHVQGTVNNVVQIIEGTVKCNGTQLGKAGLQGRGQSAWIGGKMLNNFKKFG